jgi:long-chain acyl-CoA synthetase
MNSILKAVSRHAHERPDTLAVTDGHEALTYEALWRETGEWAETLASFLEGTGPIGVCLDNSPGWVLLDLALIKLRLPSVPLPVFATDAQRRSALSQCGAGILISDREMPGWNCSRVMMLYGRTLYLHHHDGRLVELPAGTARITYTAGVSGQPKGVCLSQSALEGIASTLVDVIDGEYFDVHCAVLPLATLLENVAGLYPMLLAGGRYHVPSSAALGFPKRLSPDFTMLARTLEDCGATSTILMPEALHGLIAALEGTGVLLPSMKLLAVGGAKISPTLLKHAHSLNLPVYQGYGLSETASVAALNTPDDNRLFSVGRPMPGVGLELAADGEILINNPAYLGYVGEEAPTGRFATGDLGHFDDAGYLYIDGRKLDTPTTSPGHSPAERADGQRMTACLKQRGHCANFFARLIAVTTPECAQLRETPQVSDGLAGRISRSTYLQYLAESYYHAKHTIRLMQLAYETLASDRVWLREALGEYIGDKTGHEECILDDIAQAGGDVELIRHATPRFATELMVAYAYDFVRRVNPMGIFGIVFVLESTGALLASRVARALMQTLRLPESCFRFLLSPRAMDVERVRFLQNLMYRIDDPRDQIAVIRMAKAMYVLYSNLLGSIPG